MNNQVFGGMFTVSVVYAPKSTLIACTGRAGQGEIGATLAFGGELARRRGHTGFVIDLLAMEFEGTQQEKEELGRYGAAQLAGIERVAVVLAPANDSGVGARAARSEGLQLRTFQHVEQALVWLSS